MLTQAAIAFLCLGLSNLVEYWTQDYAEQLQGLDSQYHIRFIQKEIIQLYKITQYTTPTKKYYSQK